MNELGPYLSAMMIGFFGSAHCLGMCGGIASALALKTPTGPSFYLRLFSQTTLYNLGRILSYMTLGALVGLIGVTIAEAWSTFQYLLRSIASLMLILAGFYLTGWWNGLRRLEQGGAWLWKQLTPLNERIQQSSSGAKPLLMGLVWGWLPCGLVYSALTYAAVQGSAIKAASVMLAFGLGNLPAMIATGFLARFVHRIRQNRQVHIVSGLMLIGFGIWSFPGLSGLLIAGPAN